VAFSEHVSDESRLVACGGRVWLGEYGPYGGGDRFGVSFGHSSQQVLYEMDPAPLPARSRERLSDRCFQPGVGVGDDQDHPGEASLAETSEELGPEHFVFGVTHVEV